MLNCCELFNPVSSYPRARKAACGREIDIKSRDDLYPLVHVRVDWGSRLSAGPL